MRHCLRYLAICAVAGLAWLAVAPGDTGAQQPARVVFWEFGTRPAYIEAWKSTIAAFQAMGALEPLDRDFEAESRRLGRDITADFWPGDRADYFLKGHWFG
jgi:hypothetical protein